MKSFRDSNSCEWTVFEVRRQVEGVDSPDKPSGTGDGWLCFETSTAKRRLVNYPSRWKDCSDAELVTLLGSATPAPIKRASWALGDDGGGASSDARPT